MKKFLAIMVVVALGGSLFISFTESVGQEAVQVPIGPAGIIVLD